MLKSVEIEENVLNSLLEESISKYTRLLKESKRDDLLLPYLELLNKKGNNVTLGQLKSFLLNKFATEFGIHSLSASSNFYLAGVARYYFEGYLTTNKRLNVFYPKFKDRPNTEICSKLDKLIEFLRNSYIDSVGTKFEQPEDFGTLTLEKLFKKYNKKVFGVDAVTKQEEGENNVTDGQVNKNYTYKIIYNFEEAKPYSQYTQPGAWCVTYGQQHFNGYKRRLKIHYVFFLQNGFENVPRKVGKGYTRQKPHDAYGNSMIAVLQSNDSPEPIYITSRWNHGYGETSGTEADHAYTKEEFLATIGADESILTQCYEQWKKGVAQNKDSGSNARKLQNQAKLNILRKFKYAQMMINGGADPNQFFSSSIPMYGQQGNKLGKGLFLVGIEDENQATWWSMMDRKQILFDKMCVQNGHTPVLYNYTDTTLGVFNFNNGNEYFQFYNKRKRKFIDLNGATKFKYYDYSARQKERRSKYIMVALRGNEIGLINIEKGEAVKAPNGATVFESITTFSNRWSNRGNIDYSGHIQLDNLQYADIAKFVYDSSAKIEFAYSVQTDSFIQTPKNVNQEGYSISYETRDMSKMGCIAYEKKNGESAYSKIYKLWDVSSQTWFSIEDTEEFDNIKLFQNIFIYKTAVNPKEEKYFNLTKNEYLTLNGEIVIGYTSQGLDYQKWLYIQPITSERQWYRFLYSPQYNVFYKDPNGSYLVHVYGTDSHGRRGTITFNGEKLEVPMPEEYVKQLSNVQEAINKKMKVTRLNEEQFQDLIVEELTKNEVISLIRDKVDSNLDSSEFKKKVKEISAEIVSNLFKTLWQQNNMWRRACQQ